MFCEKKSSIMDASLNPKYVPEKRYILFFILSLQKLCDYVSDLLLEESNVQPVSTPVTVCGDIHGQVTPGIY